MGLFKKKHELYKIVDGDTVFNITNANKFISYNSEVYEPAPVDRDSIELRSEMEKQEVSFTFDISHAVAQKYLSEVVENEISITVIENFDGVNSVIFRGRLVSVSVSDEEVSLKFESAYSKLSRTGAYRKYQRTCPYALYSPECGVKREDFSKYGTVSSQDGKKIILVSDEFFEDGYFSGGIIQHDNGKSRTILSNSNMAELKNQNYSSIEEFNDLGGGVTKITLTKTFLYNGENLNFTSFREVNDYVGDYITEISSGIGDFFIMELTIFNKFSFDIVGESVYLSSGCDKKNSTCAEKFNNISNFGGFPYMPTDNPFEVSIV